MSTPNKSPYLRAFEPDDYRLIYEWKNDPEVMKNYVGNNLIMSSENIKKWVEHAIFNDRVDTYLAICDGNTDEMVGYTSVQKINWRNKNALWGNVIIDKKHQGKGYTKSIAKSVLNFVFEELGFNRLYCDYLEKDEISAHILKKIGFVIEGVGRDEFFINGKYENIVRTAMLRDEYDEYKKNRS